MRQELAPSKQQAVNGGRSSWDKQYGILDSGNVPIQTDTGLAFTMVQFTGAISMLLDERSTSRFNQLAKQS